jgi:hypothetical protein
MADKIVLKVFAAATNPSEVGRRKAMVTQSAKFFGAVRVDATDISFESLVLLVTFDEIEKAMAFQENCKKQQLLRILEGVPGTSVRMN